MNELASWLERFWIDVGLHLWQTALFVGLLALLALALQNGPARLLSLLYWCGIAKLLLPLPWLGAISIRLLERFSVGTAAPASPGFGDVRVWIYPMRFHTAGVEGSWVTPLLFSLTSIWIGGIALCVLRRLRRLRVPTGRTVSETAGTSRLAAAISDVGLSPDRVRVCPSVAAPCVSGRIRPVILLPRRLVESLEIEELTAVLVHEREHLLRYDTLRYDLLFLVHAVYWFYPPLWWLARRIRQTTEMACDEAVVRAGLSAATYCRSLARTVELGLAGSAQANLAVSPVGILGHRVSFMRQRLERIRSQRRFETMLTHRLTLAAAAVAAVALSLLPIAPAPEILAGPKADADLERLADADLPVMLNFQNTEPAKILDALSRTSGVKFEIVGSLPDRGVTIDTDKVRLVEALKRLGSAARLKFRVLDPHRVEVDTIRLAGVDGATEPRIITKVRPEYPEEARKHRRNGKVVLQAVIGAEGTVDELEVLNSTSEIFNDAAMDAVRQWIWEPATVDGKPVSVYFTVVIEFSLSESPRKEL